MNTFCPSTLAIPDSVLRTRAGLPKSRYSQDDKLRLSRPSSGLKETWARVQAFLIPIRLLGDRRNRHQAGARPKLLDRVPGCPRRRRDHRPSTGQPDTGPATNLVRLTKCQDQSLFLPGRRRRRYGREASGQEVRSGCHARRYAGSRATQNQATLTLHPNKPSFADRCESVERAFRRMGINPENPRSVLILRSPSGGRHYYVFLDALYGYPKSGLAPGCRPASRQGTDRVLSLHIARPPSALRLPSRSAARPGAWIQFIDDYDNGRIIRHSLADLQENLEKHHATQHRRIESRKNRPAKPQPTTPGTLPLGTPRRLQQTETKPAPATGPQDRYLQLLEGIHSQADAEELLALGIQLSGTRTEALKLLAAHLVWFRHMSPEDAADVPNRLGNEPPTRQQRHCPRPGAGNEPCGQANRGHVPLVRPPEVHRATPDTKPKFLFAQEELDALKPSLVGLYPGGSDPAGSIPAPLPPLRKVPRNPR